MSKIIQALEAAQRARATSLTTAGGVSNRLTIVAAVLAVFVVGGGATWWLAGNGERKAQSLYREGLHLLTSGDDVEAGYARLESIAEDYSQTTWAQDALWVIAQSRQSEGQQKEARAAYVRLLQEYPDGKLAGETRKQLESLGGVPQELIAKAKTAEAPAVQTSKKPAAPVPAGTQTYVVKSGDTLSRIAKEFGTSVRLIQEANGLTNDRIYPNQELIITRQPSQ